MEIKSGDYIIHTCFFFYYSNIIDDFYIIFAYSLKNIFLWVIIKQNILLLMFFCTDFTRI